MLYLCIMYNDLLELRDHLTDIAAELYGDMYVCNDNFWGSPTERQMCKVEESLSNLNFKIVPTPEMEVLTHMMAKERGFKRKK